MMYVVAYFAESGTPKTGLSPTLEIYDVDAGTKLVNSEAMEEIGGGFYRFNFTLYHEGRTYSVLCDSVTLTGVERYAETDIFPPEIIDVDKKGIGGYGWEKKKKEPEWDRNLAFQKREDKEIMLFIEELVQYGNIN